MRTSRSVLVTACAAALVTVAGMLYAYLQRPSQNDPNQGNGDASLRCGSTVCQSVIGRSVGQDMVELLAGTGGGRIRVTGASGTFIFEMTTAEAGAQITGDSLQCTNGPVSVCLVRGARGGEVLGEALVRRDGTWTRSSATYLASGGYLGLHDVNDDSTADVVAVQLGCDGQCDQAFVQVFSPIGTDLGCTGSSPSRDKVPGWPAPQPKLSQLRPCADT